MIRGGLVTLNVSDVGRAVRFYVETLGMKLSEECADGSAVIDAGDGFRFALRSASGERPAPSAPITFHAKVAIDDAIAIFENRGVSFTLDRATGGAVTARFQDPDGNLLVLQAK